MKWLDVFRKAPPLGMDPILARLIEKRDKAKSAIEKLRLQEALAEYSRSPLSPSNNIITHQISNRYSVISRLPEMPDPDKDFFI